jgi:very-short-patch-repair endonuclease
MHRICPETLQRARVLRRPLTPSEQKLWAGLHALRLEGYKFRRQHPIGPFIVDFYYAQTKLVIEIDGDSHAEQIEYDHERTNWLENQGCQIIRFTNQEIKDNLPAVVTNILKLCQPRQK